MIRGPITHQAVPGDIPRGRAERYRGSHLVLEPPTLPIRVPFYNALPATFIPILVRGQGGRVFADARSGKYTGLAPSELFDVVIETPAYKR